MHASKFPLKKALVSNRDDLPRLHVTSTDHTAFNTLRAKLHRAGKDILGVGRSQQRHGLLTRAETDLDLDLPNAFEVSLQFVRGHTYAVADDDDMLYVMGTYPGEVDVEPFRSNTYLRGLWDAPYAATVVLGRESAVMRSALLECVRGETRTKWSLRVTESQIGIRNIPVHYLNDLVEARDEIFSREAPARIAGG